MKKNLILTLLLNTFAMFNSSAQSGDCNVNITCEEGKVWLEVASSVVRFGYNNTSTGTLINNARGDRTPYILTAGHCVDYLNDHQYDSVIFLFNYQSSMCENSEDNLTIDADTLLGMKLVAYSDYHDLDFALLRLNQDIPEHWNIHFAGWTTLENSLSSGVGIHHPSGDIKKISTSDSIVLGSYKYWDVYWKRTTNGFGITEAGSSGSALFNPDSLIIGALSNGGSGCSNPYAYDNYIRFSLMFDKYISDTTSLKSWLDPDNLGITTLKGIQNKQIVSGIIPNNQDKLIVYPNPCRDILYIKSNNPVNAQIYNSMGQLISSVQKTKNVDTRHFKSGLYWLRINNQTLMFIKMD